MLTVASACEPSSSDAFDYSKIQSTRGRLLGLHPGGVVLTPSDGEWTKTHMWALKDAVRKYGKNWDLIAVLFNDSLPPSKRGQFWSPAAMKAKFTASSSTNSKKRSHSDASPSKLENRLPKRTKASNEKLQRRVPWLSASTDTIVVSGRNIAQRNVSLTDDDRTKTASRRRKPQTIVRTILMQMLVAAR